MQPLIGAVTTGDMATSAIASFGMIAVDPTVELLESPNFLVTDSATEVLSEMLEGKNKSVVAGPGVREKIKRALFRAASDQSHYVRISAIRGLVELGDADAIRIIEGLANTDPAEASEFGGRSGVYPVRDAAKTALNRLASN